MDLCISGLTGAEARKFHKPDASTKPDNHHEFRDGQPFGHWTPAPDTIRVDDEPESEKE